MPVIEKAQLDAIHAELRRRFDNLIGALAYRPLKDDREGANVGRWGAPDKMRVTEGSSMDIRLAADDFKSVLAEVKRIK
jgi:hypothetical protein